MYVVGKQDALVMATVVGLMMGASCVGTIGTVIELSFKDIDQKHHRFMMMIGEVFAKTLQIGCALIALVAIGSLLLNPSFGTVGTLMAGSLAIITLLTPTIKSFIQHSQKSAMVKIGLNCADHIVSGGAKVINTAVLTTGVFMALGIPTGIIGGIALSALSIATYKKAYR